MEVPNNILMSEVVDLLADGKEVVLRAKGRSMMPYIHDGSDKLVIMRADRNALRVGDTVLAMISEGKYVVHRIKAISGDMITLKGDGNFRGTECCCRPDVEGILVALIRKGRRIDCNTKSQRIKAWILRGIWHYRLMGGIAFRKIFPRKKN